MFLASHIRTYIFNLDSYTLFSISVLTLLIVFLIYVLTFFPSHLKRYRALKKIQAMRRSSNRNHS